MFHDHDDDIDDDDHDDDDDDDDDDQQEEDDNNYVIIMKIMVVVLIVNQVVWGVFLSDWKSAFVLFCMLHFCLKCFCQYRLKRVVACCSCFVDFTTSVKYQTGKLVRWTSH